ncbi:hypothetical protein AKO1_014878 [Acrasis kona]|uniref:Hemolysin III n=1 Tax=Acrasis kona TaxID=1008807 RepID=A0AAW2Z0Q7_9EUKA
MRRATAQNKVVEPNSAKDSVEPRKIKRSIPHVSCCGMMNTLVDGESYIPTNVEQIANILTHAIPAVVSVAALVHMVQNVVDNTQETIVAWVYGLCMISLFSVSSLYHLSVLTHTLEHKLAQVMQTFDHAFIYIFIAASYTPWLILLEIGVNGLYGKLFCAVIWGIAVFGVARSFLKFGQSIPSLFLYLFMGWIAILIVQPVMKSEIALWGVIELVLGGLVYSAGAIIPF